MLSLRNRTRTNDSGNTMKELHKAYATFMELQTYPQDTDHELRFWMENEYADRRDGNYMQNQTRDLVQLLWPTSIYASKTIVIQL